MLNLSKSKIFLYCLIFFIFGVGLASFAPIKIIQKDLWWFGGIIFSLIILVLFWKNNKLRILFLFSLFLFLGLWRYFLSIPINSPDKIWHYNGQNVELNGYVCNEPDVRSSNQKLEICVDSSPSNPFLIKRGENNYDEIFKKISGKILVTANIYPSYEYGDRLKINCELKQPERFNNFSYDKYLARYNIYSVCYYPDIEIIVAKEKPTGVLFKKIFAFKRSLSGIINKGLPEPEASLANAFLLNYSRGMPEDLKRTFSYTGTSHFIAISGMHITVLSSLLMVFLINLGLKRKQAFYFSISLIIIYVLIIGFPASAMRAGLMGFLVLLALNLGRLNKMTNSIVLTAAVLIFINPKILRDDIGFQLSFLAVIGIIYFYPWFYGKFEDWLESRQGNYLLKASLKAIVGALLVTLSAQILTMPIIIYNFKIISVVSLLSNLLIVWTSAFLLVGLMAALFIGFIFPSLVIIIFLPLNFLIKYIIYICRATEKIPGAYWQTDYIWPGWIFLFYFGFFIAWLYFDLKKCYQVSELI